MDWSGTISAVDWAFQWDGWRALAAIGTFAAVWVALHRDTAAARTARLQSANIITAIIDYCSTIHKSGSILATAKNGSQEQMSVLEFLDDNEILSHATNFINDINLSLLPTVESITTLSVIKTDIIGIQKSIDLIKAGKASKIKLHLDTLKSNISDLESERAFIAGSDLLITTNEGHRKRRDKKLAGSVRWKALKSIGSSLKVLATNKAS